jgi:signal transduction histidine kinase
MQIEPRDWTALADLYLAANSGGMLPGLAHNLNNCSHVLDLQLELLLNKMCSGTQLPEELEKRVRRIATASKDLQHILENVGQRLFFTQKDQIQVNMPFFLKWLIAHWKHDLFFKHKVDTEIHVDEACPNLDLPPILLTLCLEEPLKNAIEACRDQDPDGTYDFTLSCTCQGEGIRVEIAAPAGLDPARDPFLPGTSTKEGRLGMGLSLVRHFSTIAGWQASLTPQGNGTRFALEISSIRTTAHWA